MMPFNLHAKFNPKSQAHEFASNVQTQANAFVESQTRDIRDEALGEIDRMHNQAASLVDRVQADDR